jgi:hypothetical protein
MATRTRSGDASRAVSQRPEIGRLRAFLDQTLGRFGYVRVPPEPPDEEEVRALIVREFQLALLQSSDELLRSESRSGMMRTVMFLLHGSVEKVKRDLQEADEYAALGPTDDERDVAEHVEDFAPLEPHEA